MDDLGDRSRETLPESNAIGRRDFLRKAAVGAASLPVAGALVGSAAARPSIRVRDRARSQFEGVTLQFAKAPHGTDEKDVIAALLKPFEAKTGITVRHTIVPWNVEGAAYATNYAGPNPYDVSYQTSTDLTGLGTKGVLELLNTTQWLNSPAYLSTRAKFIPNTIKKSTFQGKLYGLPCIIGATVMFYNKDLLAKAGVTSVPTTAAQLAVAATKCTDSGAGVWGFNVPMTDKDSTWYFHYCNIHNRGGEIISKDQNRVTFATAPVIAATQASVDLILKQKAQPPVGQYDREGGVALFKGGRLAFLQDEPLRLAVFRKEGLPFEWNFVDPVGAAGRRTIFSTTGHWVMASKGANKAAAWELTKYLSSPLFANEFGAHYGWAPVRSDVNTSKGDPQVKRVNAYVLKGWDGLPTGPKMAQLTSVYGQAIEAAATGSKTVQAAMAKAQADGTRILKS